MFKDYKPFKFFGAIALIFFNWDLLLEYQYLLNSLTHTLLLRCLLQYLQQALWDWLLLPSNVQLY